MSATEATADEWLFGWDPTPGIVSVWADRRGRALVWRRLDGELSCERASFRPWLFARSLADAAHLGAALVPLAPDQAAASVRGGAVTVRELDGPDGSYRYLLSARDGRALEQALLTGASRRLDRPVRRLGELGSDYYSVGPVEQYLMQTGRAYFRGLAFDDLRRLQLDLETTALSPEEGRIFMVAVRDSAGLETVLEAPAPEDEPQLLSDLCALVRERDPDVIENHNLFGFDLPFLLARSQALGVPLALGRAGAPPLLSSTRLPRGGRRQDIRFSVAGRELIDTLEAVWRHDFVTRSLPGYGLKAVAKAFGVAGPDRVYIPGHAVYATYQSDPERSRRYALDDVAEVAALAPRLLGASFALAGMAPRSYGRIANAGPAMGILEPMLIRAYLRSGAAPPCEPFPPSAEGHAGGATFLYAAGVARQVVKADIASMYPSLMRIYQLGPACDPLKALLTLVDRLTGLRLNHKAAARAAAPGSHDSYHHEAVQAAMKLLINSAYGYMGAESMAMFADRAAADAVTRHGREVLEQVVAGLRDRGMALLEADTDGVYFAAPPGWSEQRERALVAEVAATLPDGLKLEYDGRYQAMLSHEVKNYTLLTYDGRLISRGVAFASSRAEPFGGRFLDTALRCLLTGDVPGIQQAYFAMADALRRHALPVRDVTTYARLTKQPADYLAARERLREAPYEALLAAGRRDWKPGERVRFYRSGQGAVWVPEDAPEDATWPPYDADHYIHVLRTSFVSRLRKAFDPADFDSLLRDGGQRSMFDPPLSAIQPRWIIAENPPDAAPR